MTCCPRPITPYIHRSPRGTLVAHAPLHPPAATPPPSHPDGPAASPAFSRGFIDRPQSPTPATHIHTPSCVSLSLKTPNCFLTSTLASLSFSPYNSSSFSPLFSFLFFFLLPSLFVLHRRKLFLIGLLPVAEASSLCFFSFFFFFLHLVTAISRRRISSVIVSAIGYLIYKSGQSNCDETRRLSTEGGDFEFWFVN